MIIMKKDKGGRTVMTYEEYSLMYEYGYDDVRR